MPAPAATPGAGRTGRSPSSAELAVTARPFLFFIRDTKTNLVLFAGRVVDPTQ